MYTVVKEIVITMKWYKYDIKDLTENEYNKWYSLMSEEKQLRVDKFRFEDDKKRTVAGEMLARKAISDWCSVLPQSIVFENDEHSKPYAKGLSVHFNISHSKDMVVCAVDDKLVGIDIEKIRHIDLAVARRICTEEELCYIFGHTKDNQDFTLLADNEVFKRFFEIWTAKEASVKCSGVGVSGIKTAVDKFHIKSFYFDDYIVSIYE